MIDRVALAPDYSIPRVIKGGWQLAGGHGAVDEDAAISDMRAFFDAGVTAFDCADIYTGVETLIGRFIQSLRADAGNAVAERVQIHTKLVPDLNSLATLSSQDVEAIVDRSLKRLQVDRLHLLQFYWWDMSTGRPLDVLQHLKALQKKGKILHLGTTNWDADVLSQFADRGIQTVSAQVQYSLLDGRPRGRFADWCQDHGVGILCYGVLAGGFLTDHWLGKSDPGHEFANRSLIKYRLIIDEFGGWSLFQELLTQLRVVADRHETSIASIAARYMLDQPGVAAVILGARTARALPVAESLARIALRPDDRERIDAVLARRAGPSGAVYGLERDRAGPHGQIMKYNLHASGA